MYSGSQGIHLDWSIPVVRDLDFNPLASAIDHDALVLDYDSTGESVLGVCRWFVSRE